MKTAGFLLLPKAQAHVFTPTVKQKICREFLRGFFQLVQLMKDCGIFCMNFHFFRYAPFKFRASFFYLIIVVTKVKKNGNRLFHSIINFNSAQLKSERNQNNISQSRRLQKNFS